jgi:hypothetical protein
MAPPVSAFPSCRPTLFSLKQRGQTPRLLPRPAEQELASLAVSSSTVNPCLNKDANAKLLQGYWQTAT